MCYSPALQNLESYKVRREKHNIFVFDAIVILFQRPERCGDDKYVGNLHQYNQAKLEMGFQDQTACSIPSKYIQIFNYLFLET